MDKLINKFYGQQNRTVRVLIAISLIGILIFILTASILPFKNIIYEKLYPKKLPKAEEITFSNTTDPNAYVLEGWTKSILATNTGVYLGGQIHHVGPNTGQGVPINTSTGARVTPYPYVQGSVLQALADGSNGWYITGSFNKVGDKSINFVAHILADGTVDNQFDAQIPYGNNNSIVNKLALSPDKSTLYIGGAFTTVGGQTRNNLAAVNAATGAITPFDPNISGDGVTSIDTLVISSDGSTLYVGGYFTTVGGQVRNNIAAINTSTGVPTAWDPNADNIIFAMALSSDGLTLYVGGDFGNIGGQIRNNLAALDTTSGNASSFNPNADNTVNALALTKDNATLYVGGNFNNIAGQAILNLAAIKTSDGTATSFSPNLDRYVQTLLLNADDSILYVGGGFSTINGSDRYALASFETATGTLTSWNPKASDTPLAFALNQDGSVIYVGGGFASIGEGVAKAYNLVKLSANGVHDPSFAPNVGPPTSDVKAITLSPDGSTLYIGGFFTTVDGTARNRLAALDSATGALQAFNPAITGPDVRKIATSPDGSIVYIGGYFTQVGGQVRSNLAAALASSSAVTSFNPDVTGGIIDMVLSPDGLTLYIGGLFSKVGGQTRSNIAAIDTTTGNVTSFSPGTNSFGDVKALALSSDGATLYAGGVFTTIGGQTRKYLAAIDTATGNVTSFDANIVGERINDMALSPDNSTLYIIGDFTSVGGQTRNNFAGINTSTGIPNGWNPYQAFPGSGTFNAIAISPDGTYLYAGGCFATHLLSFTSTVAATPTPTPTATPTPTPTPTTAPDGGGGGSGDSGSNNSSSQGGSTFVPIVPKSPPKTGRLKAI